MGTPIRIIVGEPDYLAREGLVRALEAAEGLDVVSICSTMTSLESAARLEHPDVVLMPLVFPPSRAGNAIHFLNELQAAEPETGVVVTGEHSDLVHALPLFDSGIARRAFIVRSRIRNASQLTRAIREVASGNSLVDPAAVESLLNAARQRADYPFGSLTEREREVLSMIADAESNNAIARDLHHHEGSRAARQLDLPQAWVEDSRTSIGAFKRHSRSRPHAGRAEREGRSSC